MRVMNMTSDTSSLSDLADNYSLNVSSKRESKRYSIMVLGYTGEASE